MSEEFKEKNVRQKMEFYCSYQERCHQEVHEKLYGYTLTEKERNQIIVHLIEHNFLNEERFARSFARGKHRIKQWGKIRIVNELKLRQISTANIKCALTEIPEEEYQDTFDKLAQKHWETIKETNVQKKKKKFSDYLLRKGWESNLVYGKMKELIKRSSTGSD